MNNVSLVGRLTADPTINGNEMKVAHFTVAVDRRFKKEGQPTADFISCVAFGKTAEFVGKYFSKGKQIGLNGSIQTGSYTNKDGNKVYTTDVIAENVEFVGSKNDTAPAKAEPTDAPPEGFRPIDEDSMPF